MQEDIFQLKLLDVGILRNLRVRLDGSGSKASWHLKKVIIHQKILKTFTSSVASPDKAQLNSIKNYFIANTWLDLKHGLEVNLKPQANDIVDELMEYNMTVIGADK